ncbi:MAG: alpha/beta hydrolase [Gemmatimonadota bacterium]
MEYPRQSFIEVTPGVRLEVLDWGGIGPPLVLLAGAAHSAWVFEDFAPYFTDRRKVVGITRRRHGNSDAPTEPFGLTDLADDIIVVLDSLGISQADIMGHSFGGAEITQLALAHPDRIRKVVYLDGGWDFYRVYHADGWFEGWLEFPMTAEDSASVQAVASHVARTWGALLPLSELRAIHEFDSSGKLVALDPNVGDMFTGMIRDRLTPVDFAQVAVPVLSVRAVPQSPADIFRGYEGFDDVRRVRAEAVFDKWLRVLIAEGDRLVREVPGAQELLLPGAHHYAPLTDPALVVPTVRDFLFEQ